MKTILHKAASRGHTNLGWLDSHHTFSFGSYYNPERIHFGALRVLNDDSVAGGKGFDTHPHDNMEIVSIPLSGELKHKDSTGNQTVIKEGEVQVMSAGTGIFHSEYNNLTETEVKFLQIWVIPNKKNVTPRYGQISLKPIQQENTFYQILSPNEDDQGVWIYQEAWFHLGSIDTGTSANYNFKQEGNGLYIFMLDGEADVDGQHLEKKDGYGIWETDKVTINSTSKARILLMEVPMY
ncbi:MAG TPA: hypothetical protein DEO70_13585 [Bacteroidales bacterium]|nr:MAG: hypothetical protein A2X11_08920 [Bacteroidetes bacterium GWE2_42_24]OFY29952.1 MAG: hypothetical protein A2X09_15795 [Bacteroidetes bacterium GWF2_43_11]HBZ67861.1 hypothetical protein [Bacteroidales bacterium]